MTSYLLAGVTAFGMMTTAAIAQSPPFDTTNSTQPTMSTNGPAGTYDMTRTQRTIDTGGNQSDTTETFRKSQSYSDGDGALSAKTSISTTGSTTTIPAPPPMVSTTTTTTTQESRP